MLSISKVYSIDCAHQLPNHNGKCARLHGHTYAVSVVVAGKPVTLKGSPQAGMVLDYDLLDRAVKPLMDAMDHRFLAWGTETSILEVLPPDNIYWVGERTTAENLSLHIARKVINPLLNAFEVVNSKLERLEVGVRETPKTLAVCTFIEKDGIYVPD